MSLEVNIHIWSYARYFYYSSKTGGFAAPVLHFHKKIMCVFPYNGGHVSPPYACV